MDKDDMEQFVRVDRQSNEELVQDTLWFKMLRSRWRERLKRTSYTTTNVGNPLLEGSVDFDGCGQFYTTILKIVKRLLCAAVQRSDICKQNSERWKILLIRICTIWLNNIKYSECHTYGVHVLRTMYGCTHLMYLMIFYLFWLEKIKNYGTSCARVNSAMVYLCKKGKTT